LDRQQNVENPAFCLRVNGVSVTIRFSEDESADIKNKVREILTEAYEDRFQKILASV